MKMCNLVSSLNLKRKGVLFILCLFVVPVISAQTTAVEIERLLANPAVTYAQASRLVLEASGVYATPNQNEAFRYAAERNWLPKNVSADQPVRLDGVSLLFVNSFGVKGGIFYRITKAPHYAYRELVYRDCIQGRTYPSMEVSGELLLFITARMLNNAERDEAARRNRELSTMNDEQRRAEAIARQEAARMSEIDAMREAAARQAEIDDLEAARHDQETEDLAALEAAAREEAEAAEREAAFREALAREAAAREAARQEAAEAAAHEAADYTDTSSDDDDAAREAAEAAAREAAEREAAAREAAAREAAAREAAAREAAEREAAAREAAAREAAAREAAAREAAADEEARQAAADRAARRALEDEAEAAARREREAAEMAAILREREIIDTTVTVRDERVTITLHNIQFMPDSTVLMESERAKIREIANILRTIPGVRLQVSGHTALAGTAEGRARISRERAQAVTDYLISLGACRAVNVTVVGYGADRPIATNETPEGMAANRRVEITILED